MSLRDLDGLVMQSTPDFEGTLNLEVLLIKGRDVPAESRNITVTLQKRERGPIVPPTTVSQLPPSGRAGIGQQSGGNSQSQAASAKPTPSIQQPTSLLPAISPEEEGPMLEKAAALLDNLDLASARLLFEHLARLGSAKAALALGQTYDPVFFPSEVKGLRPDRQKAREWYQRAAELGNNEAAKRLKSMTQ